MKLSPPNLFFLILFFFMVFPHTARSDSETLSPEIVDAISSSKEVYIVNKGMMYRSPRYIPEEERKESFQKLSDTERAELTKYILSAGSVDEETRFKNCRYDPFITFSFQSAENEKTKEKKEIRVILCFNCDVWAIEQSRKPSSKLKFADSKPQRLELERFYFQRTRLPLPIPAR